MMDERFVPGKTPDELRDAEKTTVIDIDKVRTPETSTVPIRRFARQVLKGREQAPFIKTVISFIDVAYYIENKIGGTNWHIALARKIGQKQGLSEDDLERACRTASSLYGRYKQSAQITGTLTPDLIQAFEEEKRERLEVEQKKRAKKKRFP